MTNQRPESGTMVYWRFKKDVPGPFIFGYTTYESGNLIRLGRYNGDVCGGYVVDVKEIEWRAY